MKFRDFLIEKDSKDKHAVLAFGRLNPPTTGHELLVNKVKSIADKVGGSHHIVLSHSQDAAKNPLTGSQKLKHAKRAFPGTNFSVSDKEHPNFLKQAEKLHKSGVTHLHMVGGSDRVQEFHKTLHRYNGTHEGALFNFKKIEVHSAGERDPDAEGTTGMSASKMREHAKTGNFDNFKKGVPSAMSHEHARHLYNDVRKGMGLKESSDYDIQQYYMLTEGVEDKSIFKAVFLGGGPGSGKDFVLDNTLAGHGLVEINSDKALEYLMDKENLDKRMPDEEEQKRNAVRKRAKSITELRERLAIYGRNGLIINGTGDDPEKYGRIKQKLEELGYDTMMVLVNTSDAVSDARNVERGQRGGRTVPENTRKEKWEAVQAARGIYQQLFGPDRYFEFDNSEDLRIAPKSVQDEKQAEMTDIFKTVRKFSSTPPKSEVAQQWIAGELEKKDRRVVPKAGAEKLPSNESNAAAQAHRMGLEYYGFGRYGKNGVAKYRSVGGNLVAIPNKTEAMPTRTSADGLSQMRVLPAQKERLQKIQTRSRLKFNEDINHELQSMLKETFDLSDSSSLNLLLLGNRIDEIDLQTGPVQESAFITNSRGDIRVFMLRSAAATEAHTKRGKVIPYKNGYVVKLNRGNENEDNKQNTGTVQKEGSGSTPTSSHGKQSLITEANRITKSTEKARSFKESAETAKTKTITLQEIRQRKKALQKESIDKGIEPGMALNSYSKEKLNKRGKVVAVEMTGDETTASISAQKENELRNKGISLSSFKSKRYI